MLLIDVLHERVVLSTLALGALPERDAIMAGVHPVTRLCAGLVGNEGYQAAVLQSLLFAFIPNKCP